MVVEVRRPEGGDDQGLDAGVAAVAALRDERVQHGSLVRGEAGDERRHEGTGAAIGDRAERLDGDEPGDAIRMGDGEMHREVRAPRMADEPGALPAEMVEDRDLVGDVPLDVARALDGARLEAALLREDPVDEPVELLDETVEILGAEARAAVEQECRRTRSATRRMDLAAGDGDAEFGRGGHAITMT